MNVINRCAVTLKPKSPYIEWANQAAQSYETVEDFSSKVLLLPSHWYDDQETFLTGHFRELLEMEMRSWVSNPRTWPPVSDLATFLQWFDVEFHPLVVDFTGEAFVVERYG
jgi:hypothetical protein